MESTNIDMLVAQIASRIVNVEYSSNVNQKVIVYKVKSEDSADLFKAAPCDSHFSI
jgi:hypothetical protein